MNKLNTKQQRFVDEYMVDLNGAQAAVRTGYSEKTARQIAAELLSKPDIQAAIANARKAQQARTNIDADRVVMEAWNIVTADPRELVQVKVGCCRHCHGDGFKYQRTVEEFNRDREQWLNAGKDASQFDEQGGIGFSPLLAPHADCPQCAGDGHPRVVMMDSRNLSEKALALYAGAKITKDGMEVKMHDKAAFAEKLFKHLGLYKKDNEQGGEAVANALTDILKGMKRSSLPVKEDPDA